MEERWSDPAARRAFGAVTVVAIVLMVAACVVVGLSWRGAARTLEVHRQLPYVVSAVAGGLGLFVLGTAILYLQLVRRLALREQAYLAAVVDAMRRDPGEVE